MPLQNRVDPWGRLQAVGALGAWMGNRGVLHDRGKRVVAAWRLRRWITCVLEFRGRWRQVFAPNRYTELFFLDEATALAAGHRPCAECRRDRYNEFREAWWAGQPNVRRGMLPSADDLDRVLHQERVGPGGEKGTFDARLSSLPAGTLVEREGRACLYWDGKLRPWSFTGYGRAIRPESSARTKVLTPRSIVGALRAGFLPQVHPSAG
jgi:hypothetical protein